MEIKTGQLVIVLQEFGYYEDDKEWWKVNSNGKEGFVPTSYLQPLDAAAPAPSSVQSFVLALLILFNLSTPVETLI